MIIRITDTNTGESRSIYQDDSPFDEFPPPIWEEGNFACDCNRAIFFAEAAGEDPPKEVSCFGSRYKVTITQDGMVHKEKGA